MNERPLRSRKPAFHDELSWRDWKESSWRNWVCLISGQQSCGNMIFSLSLNTEIRCQVFNEVEVRALSIEFLHVRFGKSNNFLCTSVTVKWNCSSTTYKGILYNVTVLQSLARVCRRPICDGQMSTYIWVDSVLYVVNLCENTFILQGCPYSCFL